MTHIPTGIKVVRDDRSQNKNKIDAYSEIKKRVNDYYKTGHDSVSIEERRNQIGTSDRSDKRRTYKVKDNMVIDHITNKSTSLKNILRGKIELLK